MPIGPSQPPPDGFCWVDRRRLPGATPGEAGWAATARQLVMSCPDRRTDGLRPQHLSETGTSFLRSGTKGVCQLKQRTTASSSCSRSTLMSTHPQSNLGVQSLTVGILLGSQTDILFQSAGKSRLLKELAPVVGRVVGLGARGSIGRLYSGVGICVPETAPACLPPRGRETIPPPREWSGTLFDTSC